MTPHSDNTVTPIGVVIDGVDSFSMDNFIYYSADPVPESATILLFGTGFARLVVARSKKKK